MTDTTAQPQYHAQHAEDLLVERAFGATAEHRYFVEVGMIDGMRFSNTYALEQRGWTGLCVEAHPEYVGMVRKNRPFSTVIHAAASDHSGGTLTFHADPRGDLSTAAQPDEAALARDFGQWFEGFTQIQVPVRTLDDMLAEADAPVGMELVSIDVEGYELAVLRGFDLAHWKPRVLLLETDKDGGSDEVFKYLRARGYHPSRTVGVNTVFTRTAMDAWRVRLVRINEQVRHTAHPNDERAGEITVYPSSYETRGQFARRLFSQALRAA